LGDGGLTVIGEIRSFDLFRSVLTITHEIFIRYFLLNPTQIFQNFNIVCG
jgi:hypothetical protein